MVIDKIREVRHRISARFANDPARLVAYDMRPARRCQNRQRGDDSSSRGSTARVTRPLSGPSPDPLNNSLKRPDYRKVSRQDAWKLGLHVQRRHPRPRIERVGDVVQEKGQALQVSV
jgi:hypothetical protein